MFKGLKMPFCKVLKIFYGGKWRKTAVFAKKKSETFGGFGKSRNFALEIKTMLLHNTSTAVEN